MILTPKYKLQLRRKLVRCGHHSSILDHRNRVQKESETREGGTTPEMPRYWGPVRAKCSGKRLRALKRRGLSVTSVDTVWTRSGCSATLMGGDAHPVL